MKKILLFCTLLITFGLLFSACKNNDQLEVGKPTTMEVANPIFQAGTVMKGEKIKASFKITNTGSYPLVFGEVKPSCSCTVVKEPKKPVAPGESIEIKAEINTDNLHTKNIHKAVTLMTNTEPNITVLQIKGRIK
ncbi:MAG: hypothetical protein RLZZ65_1729 [Bacteroidota bacterium]|jgi:hypothetical protein